MNASAFAVKGYWRPASSSADIDLEAQTISGIHAPFALPTAPEPARVAPVPSCTPQASADADAIDDFFGVTRPRATRESQHDSRPSLDDDVLPPPYVDAELPAYSVVPHTKPITLAEYLFKFGFAFPPLWILGVIVLVSPLPAPADFEPDKSRTERERLVRTIRDAELRWARRCVWALFTLFALGCLVTLVALVVRYS